MALEPKQLVYQGTIGKDDNPLPMVKYEDIPKERESTSKAKFLSCATIFHRMLYTFVSK